MNKLSRVVFLLVAAVLIAGTAWGATEEFNWEGQIIPGQAIEIKGVNGAVQAFPSQTGQVEVTAVKTGRSDDPESVRIEVVPHGEGVTICAVYPGPRNRCEPGNGGNLGAKSNDVEVDFTVKVPSGVNFIGRTVNGNVSASELDADGTGYTVNGNVEISCNGFARARTVNGSVFASMNSMDWEDQLELETVNGSVSVTLPADASANLKANLLNGEIDSEFPLTVEGKWGPKHAVATLGSGGPELAIKTVNGNIKLVKMAQ